MSSDPVSTCTENTISRSCIRVTAQRDTTRFGNRTIAPKEYISSVLDGKFSLLLYAYSPTTAYKNISCKVSGLVTEANHSAWLTDELRPFVECALELFGPERLMFGSDYPVCLLAASYDRVLDSFQEILKGLNEQEREQIFAENARKFYRLK